MFQINHRKSVVPIGVAISLLLASCGSEPEQVAQEATVRPAKLITIQAADNLQSRNFPAVIDVIQSSNLAFQVGGLINELPIIEAQEVEQGQVLASLDQRDYLNQVTTAQSQFANAQGEYQRAQRLFEQDAIARSVLEQRESQFNVARAAFDSAEKALADTILIAPYTGVVSAVTASRLENVQAGQVIVSIFGNSAMEAKVNIPASIIATAPDADEYQGVVFVTLDAVPDVRIPAVFREASLQADATSQTYAASFAFTAPENLNILPGMNASVLLELPSLVANSSEDNASVPLSAVMSDGQGQYVWIVDSDSMRVTKSNVTIQDGIGEFVTVIDGLSAGDVIVGAGASYLSEGVEVRPWID